MNPLRHAIEATILRAQATLARTSLGARAYLEALSLVLKRLPDSAAKCRLAELANQTAWPPMRLAPRHVQLTETTRILLHAHAGEFDFSALFLQRLEYEREVFTFFEERLASYDAVIEIGANVGVFTLFFADVLARRDVPGQVFAFEPSGEAFARLRENLEVNAPRNVHAFQCAVGDRVGFSAFFEPQGHLTNGSLRNDFAHIFSDDVRERRVLTVDGATLEPLVRDARRVLLKIDVEGAEAIVLNGLADLLARRRPDVVVEVLAGYEDAIANVPVIAEEYDYFNITPTGPVLEPRLRATDFRDYLLTPKARRDGVDARA